MGTLRRLNFVGCLQTFNSIRVHEFQHETNNFGCKVWFHSDNTLGGLAKCSHPLSRGIFPGQFSKEGFEVVCSCCEDALVSTDFNQPITTTAAASSIISIITHDVILLTLDGI